MIGALLGIAGGIGAIALLVWLPRAGKGAPPVTPHGCANGNPDCRPGDRCNECGLDNII